MIIPAKFQPSSSTGMGGKWGDRQTRDVTLFSRDTYPKKTKKHNENSQLPPSLCSVGIILVLISNQGKPKTLLRSNFKKCEKCKFCKFCLHSQIFIKFELWRLKNRLRLQGQE